MTRSRTRDRHRAIPLVPELRTRTIGPTEVREASQSGVTHLRGFATVYYRAENPVESTINDHFGSFRERVMPGSFAGVLERNADVRLLVGHDSSSIPLARTSAGTMELRDTSHGLEFDAKLSRESNLANDAIPAPVSEWLHTQ